MQVRPFLICLTLIGAVGISGCSTPAERAASRAEAARALEARFVNACLGYGFKNGSPEYNQCLANERKTYKTMEIAKSAEREANRARRAAAQAIEDAEYNARRAKRQAGIDALFY